MFIPGGSADSMRFKGVYAAETSYQPNDLVTHDGKLWVAVVPVNNETPNIPVAALLGTCRGVKVYVSDRAHALKTVTISPASDTNDINGRKSAPILIDKINSDSVSVSIKNLHPTAGLSGWTGDMAGNYDSYYAWSGWAPGATRTINYAYAADLIVIVNFDGVDDGQFEVSVTPLDKVVAPPSLDPPSWQPLSTIPTS